MKFLKYLLLTLFLLFSFQIVSGQNISSLNDAEIFTVRGNIRESDTRNPIENADIQVNGGSYTKSSLDGTFRIQVKKGDQIVISHDDFETVYYTIKDNDDITVEVQSVGVNGYVQKIKTNENTFRSSIDSAIFYKKISAEKSIQFITESISKSTSVKENAQAFEVLGDVNMYWKQYDLATTNYRISLKNESNIDVKLKLAKAYFLNKNYQKSLEIYNDLEDKTLNNWQQIEKQEGLGDVFLEQNKIKLATQSFKQGLKIAETNNIKPKITDLNSKLGDSYSESGNKTEAESYFTNSINLASKENKAKALEQKIKIADFQNTNRAFDKEIQLRKEIIKDIDAIEKDSVITNESPLTKQKQNYKIGNAYFLKNNLDEAIPYLEESIEEADKKEDLIVKKDATKKLADVFVASGNFEKAKEAFNAYTEAVDQLYIKKEQEISQAARISKSIAEKQNRILSLENDRQLTLSQMQLSDEKNKRQQLIIYSLIGGLFLLVVLAYLMYKYIKQQKLANNLLALKSLRSQMNPHFIFNALNSVNSFIATNDERTANKYLSDFSKLMRAVLENSEEDFIPLQKEIQLIELYTKLEHFRFKDKFNYKISVEETIDIEAYKIPPMLLQPYIENAVWHGLRYKEDKGILDIKICKKQKDQIEITIADNGIGRKKSKALKTENQKKHNSKGLGNIKKRVTILNEMYKDKVDINIEDNQLNAQDVGTKVIVTLKKD
ncbi:tetratricopeptide (TPR) repeat protein [Mesoflavibacter sabulilitoris]|uniref:Sensor histidine kinase n=1 Tax=Mesoflavibacter zeaxanthinifaciens subsp. sabulilitoris TaxID=1520893 RepID=A0A2T1NLP6_9FLAO|nr:histidine kinase [Mesoflavibacter zeaxanthinifaciens]MBB3124448.1 tetratricopeptide (TPR) repeat protein [Mesoflavibacter zeaxanthinifaciens subsp. sabulilitoris]PSG93819.1 sensor histidine kinase [Mesoflavibacter zeaxanthinifaciens subsp. sabulilitoris]